MGKRDSYRDQVDWETVERACIEARHQREMRELMMPERGVVVDECRWGPQ